MKTTVAFRIPDWVDLSKPHFSDWAVRRNTCGCSVLTIADECIVGTKLPADESPEPKPGFLLAQFSFSHCRYNVPALNNVISIERAYNGAMTIKTSDGRVLKIPRNMSPMSVSIGGVEWMDYVEQEDRA